MKKSLFKVLAVVMAVITVITGTSLVCFAADAAAPASPDLGTTLAGLFAGLSQLQLGDFASLFNQILKAFGYPGEYVNFSSMAAVMDWFLAQLGIAEIYQAIINRIDAAKLLEIATKLLGLFAQK